jgi:Flp pilus assembly protein TadG
MMLRRKARTGSILIEGAFVYPVLFLLILAILLLGSAVFRFQQVSHISREASRWASVHGAQYAQEQNTTPATATDVYNNAIVPMAAGTMDLNGITYSVTWNTDAQGNPITSPVSGVLSIDPVSGKPVIVAVQNTVTVTVTYAWDTGLFGVIPVSSTSVNTIQY